MAYTDIDNPTEIFTANLYSVNATNGKTITTGHTNDLIWTKGKSGTYGGRGLRIIDSVRGATKVLRDLDYPEKIILDMKEILQSLKI